MRARSSEGEHRVSAAAPPAGWLEEQQCYSPRKEATVRADWAMFISRTRSAWVEKPSRELFWERSCTSCFRMAEFSWRRTAAGQRHGANSGLAACKARTDLLAAGVEGLLQQPSGLGDEALLHGGEVVRVF